MIARVAQSGTRVMGKVESMVDGEGGRRSDSRSLLDFGKLI